MWAARFGHGCSLGSLSGLSGLSSLAIYRNYRSSSGCHSRSSARRCTVTPSAKSNSSVLAELRICQVQF